MAGVDACEPRAPAAIAVAPTSIDFFMKSRLFTLVSFDILLPPYLYGSREKYGDVNERTGKASRLSRRRAANRGEILRIVKGYARHLFFTSLLRESRKVMLSQGQAPFKERHDAIVW
jgi:hypothetical protein